MSENLKENFNHINEVTENRILVSPFSLTEQLVLASSMGGGGGKRRKRMKRKRSRKRKGFSQ